MQKFNNSLPGRILTVILASLTASGLAYLVLIANRGILPRVLHLTLICALGFSAGFFARAFIPGRAIILQWLSALLGLLAGLVLLGFLSQGMLGARLPVSDAGGSNLDWLIQFAAAGTAAFTALSSWKTPRSKGSSGNAPIRQTEPQAASHQSKTRTNRSKISQPARRARRTILHPTRKRLPPLTRLEYWEKRWGKIQQDLRRWWEHGIPDLRESGSDVVLRRKRKPAVRVQAKPQVRRPRKNPGLKANVRLIGKEEHRCPYCLEEVHPRDSRGVKVCPICHTHHHADCWAVTGTCQVPHYHE